MRTLIALLVAALLAPVAMPQAAAPPKSKSVPESAEHKYARRKVDEAKNRMADLTAQLKMLNAQEADLIAKGESVPLAMTKVAKDLADDSLQALEEQFLLEARLKDVDGCLAIYRKTIDKKASDLTVRESEQVKACQSAGLYPPEK